MLPRRPIMFLRRSIVSGKASLHCKNTLAEKLFNCGGRGKERCVEAEQTNWWMHWAPPSRSCLGSAHCWLASRPSHSTSQTRLCSSPTPYDHLVQLRDFRRKSLYLITEGKFKFVLDNADHSLNNLDPPHPLLIAVHLHCGKIACNLWFGKLTLSLVDC